MGVASDFPRRDDLTENSVFFWLLHFFGGGGLPSFAMIPEQFVCSSCIADLVALQICQLGLGSIVVRFDWFGLL